MTCPICNTETSSIFQKSGIAYDICPKCQCCFTLEDITSVCKTQNNGTEVRNTEEMNKLRLKRILENTIENPLVLDFGSRQGQFCEFLDINHIRNIDIDQNTFLQLGDLSDDTIDVINCVEVIEHIISPKEIVDHFERILKPDGIIYLETGFTDVFGHDSFYTNPEIGHVLVHSYKSLGMLFKNFELTKINDFVIILKKKKEI